MNQNRLAPLVVLSIVLGLASTAQAAKEPIPLLVAGPIAAPVEQALDDLQQALKTRGLEVERRKSLPVEGPMAVVVGLAGASETVDLLLTAHGIALPKPAESLCIQKLRVKDRPVLLIAGRDARGLSYALTDVARAIELAPQNSDPWAAVSDALETPFLRTRSLTVHLFNADLEKDWYHDDRFWRGYFRMLARQRYNNLSLTFSDQTNYLNPLYAYLVDVPGYPEVRVKGLSEEDRRRNLRMLQRIAELAQARGIDFTLGIWMQQPVPNYAAAVLVEKLPEGAKAADYCARGLKLVLEACPAINGIQFRMNDESGVPEHQQTEFYRPLFQAIRACGHSVRLDLRYKGLQPTTTKAAIDIGLDVTVSTKFWCEHLGLPYHPTAEEPRYRESRYGFGAMLYHPRDYRVVYRLWSVGSQRLLLWGDPEFAARFLQSCRQAEGEGFEVFAPLTNKGFGNEPGQWRLYTDRTYEHYTWEYEKYWYFYLVFGRLGYNPQASSETWRRELRHRFGDAASEVESAYRQASQIIPFITATHLPSASEFGWWPEMDTGGRLSEYMHVQTSDTAQFYAIRAWKQTPRWGWEGWDATVRGYAEDAVAGQLRGKWTPIEISQRLRGLSDLTLQSLERASAKVPDPKAAAFRATDLDLRVLAHLARYHAEKMTAATHLAFFELTDAAGRLRPALAHMQEAAAAWQRIVQLTDGVYHQNLVFGKSPAKARKFGPHHTGHWKDRLAEVREDVTFLEELLKKHGGRADKFRTFPAEAPLAEPPRIEHTPIESIAAGADLTVTARVTSQTPLQRVLLHYRPLNQTIDWKELPMRSTGNGHYEATVPSKDIPPRWDFQYYFEALVEGGGGRLWPSWEQGPPYLVVKVQRPPR